MIPLEKEISLISCPITNQVKALSDKDYPKLPNSVLQHPDYMIWITKLRKYNLKPIFKIIDVVDTADAFIIYNMYLGLFRSWNVPLLNYSACTARYKVFEKLLNESRKDTKNLDKYLIGELGYIHEHLQNIYNDAQKSKFLRSSLVYQIILYCGIVVTYDIPPDEILQGREKYIRRLLESKKGLFYLNDIFSRLIHLEPYCQVFTEIADKSQRGILNVLNHLFAYHRIPIVLNSEIWTSLYRLHNYVHSCRHCYTDYKTMTQFSKLICDNVNSFTLAEFNRMGDRVQSLMEQEV